MRTLLLFMLAGAVGCRGVNPLPDRLGVGMTIDAETHEVRSYQGNLYWSLRPEK